MIDELERLISLQNSLAEAERKARAGDFKNTKEQKELRTSILETLSAIEGKKLFIGEEKDLFAGEPFNQVIHRNLDLLNQINYLTTAEGNFLFRIQAYLEFKSNVIICREEKFKRKTRGRKKEVLPEDSEEVGLKLPKAATVTDIAQMIGDSRKNVSNILQSLKEKELVLNPEGAGTTIENGRTVTPRTWIVNPYIMICAPRKNEVKLDTLTMRLFQHSLKNLKDKDGKKVKLPVRFF